MSLNASIVEDAALEWFGGQTRFARTLTRPLPGGEEKREVIRRLNPAIPFLILATLRDPAGVGLPKLLGGELSVATAGNFILSEGK